ncbi:YitT family protein [Weissella cibaria]|uniref:YitT family protein n=1 Tax=Weissella cibaria TaxID=137591 RepID=UPI001D04210D|nr:YitT family protein [Weissella cibaria]MCB5826777.1 YitT family protein [Weissella cibaria]MCB5858358.1 YitT family protein [Weissella cibaria]MCB5860456.1 YitT family protein [Weissella cibaria]MCB5862990.1 YitT family protein [Weissella cibaria]MCB5864973.1 YitT family protein [Weissella cibaria]
MPRRLSQQGWFRVVMLVIALEIIALSINFFYAPINVAAGGATGVAILLDAAFGINRALTVLIINIAMIILAAIFLDKSTVRNIAFGSFLLPVLMYITPSHRLVEDAVLAVIIGGAVFASGIAILYRLEASSGGTTVPPMILKKYFKINSALSLLAIDMVVTLFNLLVSGTNAFFLAAFSLVITSIVMRYIETGLDLKHQVKIMSNERLADIQTMLLQEDQSLTVFDVRGGYTDNNKEMLMVMVDNANYGRMLRRVHDIDQNAFIVTTNVHEVHGGTFGI